MNAKKNLVTKDGLKKLKDELEHLTTEVRQNIAEDIQKAKEFGDLSENAAYASAIEARDLNETRIGELEEIINNSKIVSDTDDNGEGVISVGDTVTLRDENGSEFTITIVGVGESDPMHKKVASDTPLAQSVLGKKAKTKVNVDLPSGRVVYDIVKVKG